MNCPYCKADNKNYDSERVKCWNCENKFYTKEELNK